MPHPLFNTPTYTFGQLFGAVLAIHEPVAAKQFYQDYIEWAMRYAEPKYQTPDGAQELVRSNIGWIFGEGMPQEDIDMWAEVTGSMHPVFGPMNQSLTPEEAFDAGLKFMADKP